MLSRLALLRSLVFVADCVAADDFCRHFAQYSVAVFCIQYMQSRSQKNLAG